MIVKGFFANTWHVAVVAAPIIGVRIWDVSFPITELFWVLIFAFTRTHTNVLWIKIAISDHASCGIQLMNTSIGWLFCWVIHS